MGEPLDLDDLTNPRTLARKLDAMISDTFDLMWAVLDEYGPYYSNDELTLVHLTNEVREYMEQIDDVVKSMWEEVENGHAEKYDSNDRYVPPSGISRPNEVSNSGGLYLMPQPKTEDEMEEEERDVLLQRSTARRNMGRIPEAPDTL
jgi:hypothetical protein